MSLELCFLADQCPKKDTCQRATGPRPDTHDPNLTIYPWIAGAPKLGEECPWHLPPS